VSQQSEQTFDITLNVNGVSRAVTVPSRLLLSDALRHELGLTGTHVGCEHGVCGACTVLVDGKPMRSCLMLAVTAQRHEITTVEGLADEDGRLGAVQQGFRECHGLQCGFCTPGFLTTVSAFLKENPHPTREEAVEAVTGNLCRCTGYHNIVESVLRAAEITEERAATAGATQTKDTSR
jgi:carbon-monoxide dehydrogenase small subunit